MSSLLLRRCCSSTSATTAASELLTSSVTATTELVPPLWGPAEKEAYNKSYDKRRCHFTAINLKTDEKSIVRLTLPEKKIINTKYVKLSQLPVDAVAGLQSTLMDCKTTPKQLQHVADQLSNKLRQRDFPASPKEVQAARAEVVDQIKDSDPEFELAMEVGPDRKKFLMEGAIQAKIQRLLKKRGFSWKPLSLKTPENCAAYTLSRFGGYFAEMKRVLGEFERNGFVPENVLDYGSGIGSGFWAAFERWGDNVKEYSLMDTNDTVRHFSMDLLRGRNHKGSGEFVTKNIYFRREFFPSLSRIYDLVILHRTLIELPSQEERLELIEQLWRRTKRYLVIVESSSVDAFKAVMTVRDFILSEGCDFDLDATKEALDVRGLLDEEMIDMFADRRISKYEKYLIAKAKLPEDVVIPTRVTPGFVFAPCPHDQGCPKLALHVKEEACRFYVRSSEFRADQRTRSPTKDGTFVDSYSYLILEKGTRPVGEIQHRILEKKSAHNCVSCKICTSFNGIQNLTVGKRGGHVYRMMRGVESSQILPVDFEVVKTELGGLIQLDQQNSEIRKMIADKWNSGEFD